MPLKMLSRPALFASLVLLLGASGAGAAEPSAVEPRAAEILNAALAHLAGSPVVDALPAGAYRIVGTGAPRYYHFGTFFQEKGGNFEVVKPPAGTLVSYLPDGYQIEQAQGTTRYTFGPTRFKPVFVQGVLVYQVVEP